MKILAREHALLNFYGALHLQGGLVLAIEIPVDSDAAMGASTFGGSQ